MCNLGFSYGSVSHPITFDFTAPGKQPIPNTKLAAELGPQADLVFCWKVLSGALPKVFLFHCSPRKQDGEICCRGGSSAPSL